MTTIVPIDNPFTYPACIACQSETVFLLRGFCGGYVYITVPRVDKPYWHYLKQSCDEMKTFTINSPFRNNDVHIVHFSIQGLQDLGITCGLNVVKDFVYKDSLERNWPMNGVLFRKTV